MAINLTSGHKRFVHECAWVAGLSVLVLVLSQIPYSVALQRTPEDSYFLGQVAVADDVNSYFSFIRQAANGHWLFRNTMTYLDHSALFVNVEWLALGKAIAIFGWSPRITFTLWRILGAVALIGGFAMLAALILKSEFHRRLALVMCAIGGGFGWLLVGLRQLNLLGSHAGLEMLNPALDLSAGIQPFVQLTRNPHFSLPHGTFLITIALMIQGERTHRPVWYAGVATMAVIHGLMRPYDLISLFAIIPAFVLLECLIARRIDWRWNLARIIPLLITAPLLGYYAYLFTFDPVLKYWASQGGQPFVPVRWHLMSLGIPFILFIVRLVSLRKYPMQDTWDRLVLVWAVCIVVLFHSYKFVPFMPYTPQLAIPSVTPLILLSVTLFPDLKSLTPPRGKMWFALAVVLVTINALSTPVYLRQESRRASENPQHYIRHHDLDAVDWLNRHCRESDVVLARYAYGTRLSQFLNARVAVGHWALSPHVESLNPRIERFLTGEMNQDEARALIDEIRPRYIYADLPDSGVTANNVKGLGYKLVYANPSVQLYEHTGDES